MPDEQYQLYYFATCPFCIKALLQLRLLGIKVPLKNIHRHRQYASELLEGGGKIQVPCLRIDDGQSQSRWLYESSDIVRYLKQRL